jgi:phage tail-like protein
MTAPRRYRFATAAQWAAGRVARAVMQADGAIGLVAPWGAATTLMSGPGIAVAIAPDCIAAWNDGSLLWTDEPGALAPQSRAVPSALAAARHLEVGRTQYWACDERPLLRAYVREVPVARLEIDLGADGIAQKLLDLAADGHDGVWVLALAQGSAFALHVDCSGNRGPQVPLPQRCGVPRAMTWAAQRLVLLDADGTKLQLLDPHHPEVVIEVPLSGVRPGGIGSTICSDGRRRIVVGGVDASAFGAQPWVASADTDGEWLGAFGLDAAPVDLACSADSLIVTTARAVLRFAADASGLSRRSEDSANFTTPRLVSTPVQGRGPWLRAQASAFLPEGCTLEMRWAGTDDTDLLAKIDALWRASGIGPALQRQRLDDAMGWSAPMRFERVGGSDPAAPTLCVLPLHDVGTQSLWIDVTLVAAASAGAPQLQSLDVLYPDESLMQNLPALYRREAAQPDSFVRNIVAALETTVQDLDQRIAGLGRLLDAHDTPEPWLDAIARWLGIPWDDTLALERKRALLNAAPLLLERHGTRGGLQALLAALLPDRSRVVDVGVDHGWTRLGSGGAAGSRLPALLPGWPHDAPVLNAKACLGRARLGDPAVPAQGATTWLAGRIDIEITATPDERKTWLPWLRPLVDAMTPLTARARLHWRASTARPLVPVLDDDLRLDSAPSALLGGGATLGRSRLDARRGTTLDRGGAAPAFTLD